MPGVPAVPLELRRRGYRLALASSSRPSLIAATLAAIGVEHVFEVVVSATEVGRGKPAPDIFLEAARRLGVLPDRCLVVEDSYNGVCAALAAGMRCVAIPCETTRHQNFSRATARLASLPELLDSPVLAPPAAASWTVQSRAATQSVPVNRTYSRAAANRSRAAAPRTIARSSVYDR